MTSIRVIKSGGVMIERMGGIYLMPSPEPPPEKPPPRDEEPLPSEARCSCMTLLRTVCENKLGSTVCDHAHSTTIFSGKQSDQMIIAEPEYRSALTIQDIAHKEYRS